MLGAFPKNILRSPHLKISEIEPRANRAPEKRIGPSRDGTRGEPGSLRHYILGALAEIDTEPKGDQSVLSPLYHVKLKGIPAIKMPDFVRANAMKA
jgi:hypothetical protein